MTATTTPLTEAIYQFFLTHPDTVWTIQEVAEKVSADIPCTTGDVSTWCADRVRNNVRGSTQKGFPGTERIKRVGGRLSGRYVLDRANAYPANTEGELLQRSTRANKASAPTAPTPGPTPSVQPGMMFEVVAWSVTTSILRCEDGTFFIAENIRPVA